MNHPEITNLNAKLYFTKALMDADESRRAKKITSQRSEISFFSVFVRLMPKSSQKPVRRTAQSQFR